MILMCVLSGLSLSHSACILQVWSKLSGAFFCCFIEQHGTGKFHFFKLQSSKKNVLKSTCLLIYKFSCSMRWCLSLDRETLCLYSGTCLNIWSDWLVGGGGGSVWSKLKIEWSLFNEICESAAHLPFLPCGPACDMHTCQWVGERGCVCEKVKLWGYDSQPFGMCTLVACMLVLNWMLFFFCVMYDVSVVLYCFVHNLGC